VWPESNKRPGYPIGAPVAVKDIDFAQAGNNYLYGLVDYWKHIRSQQVEQIERIYAKKALQKSFIKRFCTTESAIKSQLLSYGSTPDGTAAITYFWRHEKAEWMRVSGNSCK
jgi:hypothetical protein